MKLLEELSYDLDFRKPRVIVIENLIILENVEAIVMVSEEAVTVRNGRRFVTAAGQNFVVKEIYEGRLTLEGTIEKVEFL